MLTPQQPSKIRHPYLSYSHNLFDSFYYFSYSQTYIENELTIDLTSITKSKPSQPGIIPYSIDPSKFTNLFQYKSSYSKSTISIDLIKQFILQGKQPDICIFLDNYHEFESEDNLRDASSSFTYLDAVDENEHINTTCVFYKRFNEIHQTKNKVNVIVPKYLCIISEYPYWSIYNKILTEIREQFLKGASYFPIECSIYNLLEYTPSPYANSIEVNYIKLLQNQINYENNNGLTSNYICKIRQLSAYPIIDYNICEIFKVIPVKMFMKIFLLSFLEIDIIFFSTNNAELLNPIMFAIANLAYPLTNCMYLWNIVTVSELSLLGGDDNVFVGKPTATMIGARGGYDKNKRYLHDVPYFVVDIDKKVFELVETKGEHNEMNEQYLTMSKYIDRIIMEKKVKESMFFAEGIKQLMKELENYNKQNIKENNNNNNSSNSSNNNKNINLYIYDKEHIEKRNLQIQSLFYHYILSVLQEFYKFYHVNCYIEDIINNNNSNSSTTSNSKSNSVNIKYIFDKSKYSPIEIIFIHLFTLTGKYHSFFDLYIQKQYVNELFEIPFAFADEFISINTKSPYKIHPTKYFQIIDSLYFQNINYALMCYNYNNLYDLYDKTIRNEIEDIIQRSNILVTITNNQTFEKHYKYLNINFCSDVLEYYTNFISSYPMNLLSGILPTHLLIKLNKTFPFQLIDISNVIEKYFYYHNEYTNEELIGISMLMFHGIILEKNVITNTNLNCIISLITFSVRKYITRLLEIVCNLLQKTNKSNESNYFNNLLLTICGLIRNNNINLNEDLIEVITAITTVIEDESNKHKHINEKLHLFSFSNADNKTMYTCEIIVYDGKKGVNDKQNEINFNKLIGFCTSNNNSELVAANNTNTNNKDEYIYYMKITISCNGKHNIEFITDIQQPNQIYLQLTQMMSEFSKNKFCFPLNQSNDIAKLIANFLFYAKFLFKELKQLDFNPYLDMLYTILENENK